MVCPDQLTHCPGDLRISCETNNLVNYIIYTATILINVVARLFKHPWYEFCLFIHIIQIVIDFTWPRVVMYVYVFILYTVHSWLNQV